MNSIIRRLMENHKVNESWESLELRPLNSVVRAHSEEDPFSGKKCATIEVRDGGFTRGSMYVISPEGLVAKYSFSMIGGNSTGEYSPVSKRSLTSISDKLQSGDYELKTM